jgi:hypothetical protein
VAHRETEVREARSALRVEIAADLTNVHGNTLQDRCMLQYLERLTEWAKGGRHPGNPGVVFNGLSSTTWDVAKTGAVAHMPLSDRLAYASFYDDVALYQTLVERERTLMTEIGGYYRLESLTPEEGRRLRLAVNGDFGLLGIKAGQEPGFLRRAKALGVQAEPLRDSTRAMIDHLCAVAQPAARTRSSQFAVPGLE